MGRGGAWEGEGHGKGRGMGRGGAWEDEEHGDRGGEGEGHETRALAVSFMSLHQV